MFSLHSARLRTVLTGLALTGLAVTTAQGFASAAPAPVHERGAARASVVDTIEDGAARSLALSLADRAWQRQVSGALAQGKAVGLRGLTAGSATRGANGLGAHIAQADRQVADAKGLGADAGSLLQVRLVGAAAEGVEPLVASSPSDDNATVVVAYDSAGKAYELAADHAPDRPVYLVDVDTDKATEAGLKVLRDELAAAGLQAPAAAPVNTAAAATGYWTTRVTAVTVSDVKEPWFKGAAEIFDLVTGFGLDGKVRVDTVTMPYLDDENKTYYPNQILVNWSLYKYNLADVVMMEDDGDTNYSALAKAIAAVLLTITDQGAYIPLANAVIDAMPASWWTDDPDYVDSWYTLATTTTGTRTGAAGNGKMTFDRYYVSAL
ncbi:DUF3103 family protein [Kitasatospora cheerisanensis]|uniref:DUF3103 domain-containing protein n=1 Tax=Kitasatospora cheerisanensis KCTC 2395 TaxID=1348663 RepID=A0A066YQK6_9ACTN|nr:DUF3103 family protein [Kitasatospora cheerisanensis]KDN82259.1 hypothetical protein KCH_59680 [Kitasatospora cheerisanensis KCTC 2395]